MEKSELFAKILEKSKSNRMHISVAPTGRKLPRDSQRVIQRVIDDEEDDSEESYSQDTVEQLLAAQRDLILAEVEQQQNSVSHPNQFSANEQLAIKYFASPALRIGGTIFYVILATITAIIGSFFVWLIITAWWRIATNGHT